MRKNSSDQAETDELRIKSFYVYRRFPAITPEKYVSDYSEEERAALKSKFAPRIAAYRKRLRMQNWCFALSPLMLLWVVISDGSSMAFFGFAALVIVIPAVGPSMPAC